MRRTALVAVLVACGGGPGTTGRFTDTSEPAAGGREAPGASQDPAGSGPEATPPGRDAPPPSQDPPPGQCLPCENPTYSCTGTVGRQSVKDISLHLQSKNGQCLSEADQQQVYVFACDRTITNSAGVAVGTWAPSPNGITVTIQDLQVTCVPQKPTTGGAGNGRDAG